MTQSELYITVVFAQWSNSLFAKRGDSQVHCLISDSNLKLHIHTSSLDTLIPLTFQYNTNLDMIECSTASAISHFFSVFSLISWMCAQLPQIYTNYVNKSAEGISPSFLLLWFMGDFLSFTSCLLNESVLAFQVYLSLFFICNDIALCCQYYYYETLNKGANSIIPIKPSEEVTEPLTADADYHTATGTIHIRSHIPEPERPDEWLSLTPPSDSSIPSSYSSINGKRQSAVKVVTIGSLLNPGIANAMPTGN